MMVRTVVVHAFSALVVGRIVVTVWLNEVWWVEVETWVG